MPSLPHGHENRDYYAELGVGPAVSEKELRQAYHRLARQHHPDRNGHRDHHRAHAVMEAYHVLGDPQRRALYDDARRRGERPPDIVSRYTSSLQFVSVTRAELASGFSVPCDCDGGVLTVPPGSTALTYVFPSRGSRSGLGRLDLWLLIDLTGTRGEDRWLSHGMPRREWKAGFVLFPDKYRIAVPPRCSQPIVITGAGDPGMDGGPNGDLHVTLVPQRDTRPLLALLVVVALMAIWFFTVQAAPRTGTPVAPTSTPSTRSAEENLLAQRVSDRQRYSLSGWAAQLGVEYAGPPRNTAPGARVVNLADTWAEHLQLRKRFGDGVVLAWGDDLARKPPWDTAWFTLYVHPSLTSRDEVAAWCSTKFPDRRGDALTNVCFPTKLPG